MIKGNLPSRQRVREILITLTIDISAGIIVFLLTQDLKISLIVIIVMIFVISGVWRLNDHINIVKKSGLKQIFMDSPDPTPLLKQYYRTSQRIRLLAIRGARMLGSDRSLINHIVRELPRAWKGTIQILLLKPDSEYLKQRAVELDHNPDQFAAECWSAINNINDLRRKFDLNIEVRLYDRKPIIRCTIFDDRALLSYYIGEYGHIPYQYEIRDGEVSLMRMINLIYDDIWDTSQSVLEDTNKGGLHAKT